MFTLYWKAHVLVETNFENYFVEQNTVHPGVAEGPQIDLMEDFP